ncbi:MAG: transcription-repair coupling factor [Candidatus Omnitrophica bacterium]|nr:transcription-repair coupling factor [Candidatus Omnitrophota bacterium]
MFRFLKLYKLEEMDLKSLISELTKFGYKRNHRVYAEGDFASRGGIVDIYPLTFEYPIRIEFDGNLISSIKSFDNISGKPLFEHSIVIVLPVGKSTITKFLHYHQEFPLDNLLDLEIGDYVVHIHHGIGRFLGIDKINIENQYKEHLIIEYEAGEKLYVPIDQIHLVQKYFCLGRSKPRKLSRLGTREWIRIKERVKKGINSFAWELLTMQAARISSKGFKFSKDNEWQKEFESTFPYKETPDQIKATEEVKADMEKDIPMDRLICGDVGYGKTEVALRAAFKAVQDFKQVAFLVPTTILAEQHYQNFISRLKNFPIRVEMLSRFKTKRQQNDILKDLNEGRVDIIIGTHRLLGDDVKFKDLGLLIIDEEQRFGVKAKEKLKMLKINTDVLTLTATPIPRTLYMGLMGIKDISIIQTPPPNRLPIETYVVEYDIDLIRQAILREYQRRGQVYFVHNRITDIQKIKEKIASVLPSHIRIGVAHGKMPALILEKIILDFFKGKLDVLISTNIIESGLDIPNANTLIVNNAYDFGLADLHQLRGRVGRFERKAYAYFLIPKDRILSSEAKRRLQIMQSFVELGCGFKIAMQDLQMRGAGNILGYQQHGFVVAVGFDLYCRLLRETVANLKKIVYDEN